MAQSIGAFLTQIGKNNGIRTQNLFELHVVLSDETKHYMDGAQGGGDRGGNGYNPSSAFGDENQSITFYGQNFTLPTRTIEMNTVSFRAFDVPIPGKFSFTQEHTMTLNCDMNNTVRNAFLAWQAATTNPDIDLGSELFGDKNIHLDDTIIITLLGNNGEHVEKYVIKGVKVREVGGLTVSNTDAGISTFDVTFSSVYWTHIPSDYTEWKPAEQDARMYSAGAGTVSNEFAKGGAAETTNSGNY